MSSTISRIGSAEELRAEQGAGGPRLWVYQPWVDLLIGCGAWSGPLLFLANHTTAGSTRNWSFAFYFLALLFNYPHFMATVYRAYHSYDEFSKYRFFTVHMALLLACAGLLAHLWYPLLPWIFTLYICWSPWHYTGQNYGLSMMFVRRAGLTPTETERQALHAAFLASYLMLLFSFHTGASGDALILSLELPAKFTMPGRAVLGLFFLGASGWALFSLARRSTTWKALLPSATLVTTQFLWFLLPAAIELLSGKEVPQTRYSSGILAVLHSAQYLWITSYYQRKEARAAGQIPWRFWKYLLTLVAGGIALFIPGPWVASRIFHSDFASSFLTFTALVNLHHFLLDGALWKLRDSRIASLLLGSKSPTEESSDRPRAARVFRWFGGSTPAARLLRISLLLALLLCGAMDQVHFYWANVSASFSSLQRAARWNPDDSAVQSRLAAVAEAAGKHDVALKALQLAARISPGNRGLQDACARGLIEAGQDAEAFAFYEKLLDRWPQDANALLNYGVLAKKLGHSDEALDAWQRAAAADPTQTTAQLYVAQTLDSRGEAQAAARHYRMYLERVSSHPSLHPNEGPTVIAALIKVADADAVIGKTAESLRGYQAAARFAEKLKHPGLQSLALAHAAEAQEKSGATAQAAQSLQQAIVLDETQGEPKAAAADWYNYGQFLMRQKQPERFVFVCFYRAQDLLSTNPGTELDAISAARAASEARLGAAAGGLPQQVSKLLTQVLSLGPEAIAAPANRTRDK